MNTYSPILIKYDYIKSEPRTWLGHPQIIYILSGSLSVNVNNSTYRLEIDDLMLINAFDLYELSAKDCRIASFHIDLSKFNQQILSNPPYHFDCNSATRDNDDSLSTIKGYLAKLIKASISEAPEELLISYAHSYNLLHHLITHYQVQAQVKEPSNLKRMENIIAYIHQHYAVPLTLKDLSKTFYLSAPYLSKLFKETLGMNFKDYLNNLRLDKALETIGNTNQTIDFIATSNGFPNARSFSKLFQEKYGLLPSAYRQEKVTLLSNEPIASKSILPTEDQFTHHQYLGTLAQYLNTDTTPHQMDLVPNFYEIPATSTITRGHPLMHTYRKMTSIGRAKSILYGQNQAMLTTLQEEIGFQWIRFHGLLDDDMMLCSIDAAGELKLNFTYIDMVMDFLLTIKLKPFIELGFMPEALAAEKNRRIYNGQSIISLPNNFNLWQDLIKGLLIHLENRYGKDEVATWPFTLWNNPDSPIHMFGFRHMDNYCHLYRLTYNTVKKQNPAIAFGGPSVMTTTMEDGLWMTGFLAYCTTNACVPDFLSYNYYPVTHQNTLSEELQTTNNVTLRPSADAMKESIDKIIKTAKKQQWPVDQLYITEWNNSISHRELLNDTAFKAPYIVKNILENYDRVQSFTYWGLTDFIEEVQISNPLFHGGIGLFTYNGIKKAHYHALRLMTKLGDECLSQGTGYFITKKGQSYQVLLYNYHHFSSLYASGELFDMTPTNRYTPFIATNKLRIVLPLTDLVCSSVMITDTFINRQHGSPFDTWVALGALPLETKEETDYLKSISVPKITKEQVAVVDGMLTLSRTLEAHEVRLVEISVRE